jgi:SAM-dependent methyltransferase
VHSYYDDKLHSLADIFGASSIELKRRSIEIDGHTYPVVDDVIVALDPQRIPASLRARLGGAGTQSSAQRGGAFSADVQSTFGAEWEAFPDLLPEHEDEFARYFDLVNLESLTEIRIADLGCGNGRWSYFLEPRCRELVLVDFSEAIFVARRNLRHSSKSIFILADVTQLPFRSGFAELVVCLGVLHHLPVHALDAVRSLARFAPRLLIYLYYALDNRQRHYRLLLDAVTVVRKITSRLRSPGLRRALSWVGTLGLYCPLIAAGTLMGRIGAQRLVPLHDSYRGKSLRRIQQDVYDRFFTSIEQRFTRAEIQSLQDTFQQVVVSDGLPYWHFVCEKEPADEAVRRSGRIVSVPRS